MIVIGVALNDAATFNATDPLSALPSVMAHLTLTSAAEIVGVDVPGGISAVSPTCGTLAGDQLVAVVQSSLLASPVHVMTAMQAS
jgi:hypothetical protein